MKITRAQIYLVAREERGVSAWRVAVRAAEVRLR
jgi:hypothetical protein